MAYDWLESWLMSRPGAEHDYKAEWGWDRYMVRGKLFAAICSPSGMTDTRYNGHTLVNLKCDPRLGELLRERYPEVLPGFYCDKRTWIAVLLDGDLPDDVLRGLCDRSYALVFGKLTKKLQLSLIHI